MDDKCQNIVNEYYLIIKNKISQARFEGALSSISKLLDYSPYDKMAYYYAGICKFALEKYQESIKNYKKAIEINPSFAKSYFNLGVCYYMLHLYDDALVNIARAMVLFEKEKELDKKHKCYEAIRLIDKERKEDKI